MRVPPIIPEIDNQSFLPTFEGQIIHVTKTSGKWYFGEVLSQCTLEKKSKDTSKLEGWFPATFCKPASLESLRALNQSTSLLNGSTVNLMPPNSWKVGREGLVKLDRSDSKKFLASQIKSQYLTDNTIKIERIQALDLWRGYCVKRDSILQKYSSGSSNLVNNTQANLEMTWLFHGTTRKAAKEIARQGFNRSFAGQQTGCLYGKGVYFAKDLDYAMKYAKPDSKDGLRRMFLCRVAVGDWCKGVSEQLQPSPGYDSAVNNVSSPSMFIIYHDTQVYPEYLITFG